jgi:IS1 family transposase
MNWSLFPPRTREVQLDEKWAFVGKKQANCDPDEQRCGDCWDPVAFDPEHRLVVSVVPGKRSPGNVRKMLKDFKRRTANRVMNLITTDEYPAYKGAILEAYGRRVVPLPQHKPGRRALPYRVPPADLTYAMLHKTRKNGRVVMVQAKQVFGTRHALAAALKQSTCSRAVNTAFIERHNGTDRHHNARKARQTYRFSKDWEVHVGVTYFTMYSYNFCWPVRTLAKRCTGGNRTPRSPAMAAGLADHVWSIQQWVTLPAVQSA